MIVYFGYTYCPDVCPTDLMAITQALDALGPAAEIGKTTTPTTTTIPFDQTPHSEVLDRQRLSLQEAGERGPALEHIING